MCSGSSSACLDSYSVDFGAKIRACRKALKPGCLAQGGSAGDTVSDGKSCAPSGCRACSVRSPCTCRSRTVGILEIAGIQAPVRGLFSGARTICSIPSCKSQCVEGGVIFADWWSRQCAFKLSILTHVGHFLRTVRDRHFFFFHPYNFFRPIRTEFESCSKLQRKGGLGPRTSRLYGQGAIARGLYGQGVVERGPN